MVVDDKLRSLRKEADMAYFKPYTGICTARLSKTTKYLVSIIGLQADKVGVSQHECKSANSPHGVESFLRSW